MSEENADIRSKSNDICTYMSAYDHLDRDERNILPFVILNLIFKHKCKIFAKKKMILRFVNILFFPMHYLFLLYDILIYSISILINRHIKYNRYISIILIYQYIFLDR